MGNFEKVIKTKYYIDNIEQERERFKNPKEYFDFVESLYQILSKDGGYKYHIFDKVNDINEVFGYYTSTSVEFESKKTKVLNYLKSVCNNSKSYNLDMKSQYSYIYVTELDIPFTLKTDMMLNKINKDNYDNLINLNILKMFDKNVNDFEIDNCNYPMLITINSILFEDNAVSEENLDLFEKVAKAPLNESEFKDKKTYLRSKLYQTRVLRNIKKTKNNLIKDEKNKVKVKKI